MNLLCDRPTYLTFYVLPMCIYTYINIARNRVNNIISIVNVISSTSSLLYNLSTYAPLLHPSATCVHP